MRILHFILSHSIFISLCAAALCLQTDILLHIPHDEHVIFFVFFSTLCSYNFYWLLSKFYFSGRKISPSFFKKNISFLFIFFIAAGGTFYYFQFLAGAWPYIAGALIFTLLYSLPLWPFSFALTLQKAGFFKTTLLAFTWAYVTTIIPAMPVIHSEVSPVLVLLAARFFFMLLLCVIFDMRDISVDKMHGLHSLATDIRKSRLAVIVFFIFIFYMISGFIVRNYFNDNNQLIAFSATGLIVWVVYRMSRKKRDFIFYYFLVDGLMFISALFTYLASMV